MKIGLFFGAGAEMAYGLPSGGKFAIELFRQDTGPYKAQFREALKKINPHSTYATQWLPPDYTNSRVHAFGKNEFTSIIESSIEYKKNEIIKKLNAFDSECDLAIKQLGISREMVSAAFKKQTGREVGESLYSQVIKLNTLLSKDVSLFGSDFYSAMLDLVRDKVECEDLKRYVSAFVTLLVGAQGQELVQRLNETVFEKAPDDLNIFDDISGMFRLDFNRIGGTALELLLAEKRTFNVNETACAVDLLSAIAQQVLENLFTNVLDYQALIDSHFRYLYSPQKEWAKFTRMVIFLYAAREYIAAQEPDVASLNSGYYHDLSSSLENDVSIEAIGTANYNSILEKVAASNGKVIPEVIHLNGGVMDFYNPYKNLVLTCKGREECPADQLYVPFILTQSGLKPLTSVKMSKRYVDLFDSFSQSDAIVVVGFGFHADDSHINGLFRELVETKGKYLYWVCSSSDGSAECQKRALLQRLRLDPGQRERVIVVPVDPKTRQIEESLWVQYVTANLRTKVQGQQTLAKP